MVVSTLALAGCTTDAGVDWYVKDYEGGDVEVKSCQKLGEAITDDDEYGATLDEVWKCAVKKLDGTFGFVDACYVVRPNLVKSISRKIRCASVGPGCPRGGRRDREAQTVFLGLSLDPSLVLEELRGNHPAYKTVRVDVFYQETEGAKEHCGYLNVRVPIADDVDDPTQQPTALTAENLESSGWTEPHYSFSYSLLDD